MDITCLPRRCMQLQILYIHCIGAHCWCVLCILVEVCGYLLALIGSRCKAVSEGKHVVHHALQRPGAWQIILGVKQTCSSPPVVSYSLSHGLVVWRKNAVKVIHQ